MPNLTPTRATAECIDGEVRMVKTKNPCMAWAKRELVPCLIMPAPVHIAECPPEWKDGRRVMLHTGTHWVEAEWLLTREVWACAFGAWVPFDFPTRVMLPPPVPEEVKHG